jgi:hypothetical protein
MPGPLREAHKIIIKECAAGAEPPVRHGICKIFMQGHLREDLSRISTRPSVKDLY